ncbi:MAG: hypothetical protein VX938_06335, partial [Myxococcota bacterium]|nr:hypothetical protein [Myxococcota bacterium]
MRIRTLLFAPVTAAALLVMTGCSSGGSPTAGAGVGISAETPLDGFQGVGTPDGEGPTTTPDATGPTDPVPVDVSDNPADAGPANPTDTTTTPEPGEFGSPCESNEDCFSGWCVEGPTGYICTQPCLEACPKGYDCKSVQGKGDVVFLCLPKVTKLCLPCDYDAHCGAGSCVDLDGERRCV